MAHPMTWLGLVTLLAFGTILTTGRAAPSKDDRKEVAAELRRGLEASPSQKEPAERRRALVALTKKAFPRLTANVVLTDALRQALDGSAKLQDEPAAVALEKALREAISTLTFEPKMEAKLPEGFPQPTPVGEIRVQSYPAYRLARVSMKKSGDSTAFFTLFDHISKHKIAMTAPVEMTRPKDRVESMAFLYQNTKLGKLGKDGEVEVVDVPSLTAASLGMRGRLTEKRVEEARGRLEAWLKQHAREYEAAGPLRVLGYNSPFIPEERQYDEVQIPVRKVK